MNQVKAEELAHGRWPDVLVASGLSERYLTGKGVPCPLCGGTDRFQWVQKKGGGLYVCRHCTEGKYRSGMDLLMRHLGEDFIGAANYVRSHFGVSTHEEARRFVERFPVPPSDQPQADAAKARRRMERHWSETQPVSQGDPVDLYLRRRVRGLQHVPPDIRFHPDMEYWQKGADDKPVLVGRYPAMVVRGFDPEGNWVQLHKTYLTHTGDKADVEFPKKTDMGVGANSYAFRLGHPVNGRLGVAEGIETALSAWVRDGVPVWPCHSSTVLENFRVPLDLVGAVQCVWIYADNDPVKHGRRAGQKAAEGLAANLRKARIRSLIRIPARSGTDFNDL